MFLRSIVQLSLLLAVFSPLSSARAQRAVLQGHTIPAYLGFGSTEYSIEPGETNAMISVVRTGEFRVPATVKYATRNSSAVLEEDYLPRAGDLTIPAGQGFASIAIPVLDNPKRTEERTIELVLSEPSPGAEIVTSRALLTLPPVPQAAPLDLSNPVLRVASAGPGKLALSWNGEPGRYQLERATRAARASWLSVKSPVQESSGCCTVIEEVASGPVFFRLKSNQP